MTYLKLDNVSLEYPLYNTENTSIKHHLLHMATGGRIAVDSQKKTVVKALSNISMDIKSGDRIGIVGHNGAGKSTLLRCITGIYQPTSGTIERQGTVAALMEIGAGMEPELSGYNNIKRLLQLQDVSDDHAQSLTESIAEFTELQDFLSLPVRTYSSGMLMRLMFSVSTVSAPDILVMDEFFSVGDDNFRKKAELRLTEHINNSAILIFASHNMELLKKFCNSFIRLDCGVIDTSYLC
ncbi:ABC transporter ATP-binding protein [Endozoicomonas sp. ALB032]|uniref:ABC transporter ATP-binding protein n=1 Tax=Endozoicomonas sp. ALB032 TaxID=3403082 RepID=UPI003BB79E97